MNADSTSMALLTNNLSDATLEKVMQFTNARDVWFKSYSWINRESEDKAYGKCMELVSFKRDPKNNIAGQFYKA